MCCIVFDASHVFVYRSLRSVLVEAFVGVLRRDVVA